MTGMTPRDIGSITQAVEVRLSPDGSQVAFTVTSVDLEANEYRGRIWLAAADGSSPPYPFTSGDGQDRLPRWAPDGRRLAFVSHARRRNDDGLRSESPGREIVVMPVTVGGQPVRLGVIDDDISELEWSPDGTRLAFVARDRDRSRYGSVDRPLSEREMPPRRIDHMFFQLDSTGWTVDRPNQIFVSTADGSRPARRLTSGPFEATDIAWSPNSRQLAFVSARHDTWDLDLANDVWLIGLEEDADPVRVTATTARYNHPAWSGDGRRLACLRTPTPLDEPRHTGVAVIDVETGDLSEPSAALDRTCAPFGATRAPVWVDGNLLFTVEDSGNVHLYQAPSEGGGEPEVVLAGPRSVSSWDWAAGTVAFVATDPVALGEVLVGAGGRRITDFTGAFAGRVELSPPERFAAASTHGTEVECWAIPPVGAESERKYPTLLNIHGGPYAQYGNRFFDEFQIQAGAGFGVVYCNPRGSSGYSEAWARATRWPEADSDPGSGWGGVDFDDVMACVEEAEGRFPWIDPARLGVIGGSYGGYLTSWIVGRSHKFAAACSERACNNLLSLEHNSDIATEFRTYVGKSHLEAPDAYLRQSPITYVKAMTTPMLIMHSEQDLRCPVNQAEELFVALRLLGRQPVMVRFPGESHELSRSGSPKHRVMRAEVILEWFEKHLGQG